MLHTRQVEVFHAIYVHGSISAAARTLRVSQPYVSTALRRLHDQLGFKLFVLVRGRLVPTDEAHVLFGEANHVFDRIESLRRAVKNIRTHGGGHIRLAVVPSLGLDIAPRAIARFREHHPDITMEIQTLHHDDLFRSLRERECDLAIAYDPPDHARLSRTRLGQGQLMVAHKPDALCATRDGLALTQLHDQEIIGVSGSGPIGNLLARALEVERVAVREVISVQTFFVAAALVRYGAGVSVVDEFTARAGLFQDIVFQPLNPSLRFSVECVHLEDRPISGIVGEFIAHFQNVLPESSRQT